MSWAGIFPEKQSHYYGTEVLLRADDGSCLTKILPDKIGRPDGSNNKCLRRRCLTVPAPTTYTKHSLPGNRLNDSRARYESLYSAWTENSEKKINIGIGIQVHKDANFGRIAKI